MSAENKLSFRRIGFKELELTKEILRGAPSFLNFFANFDYLEKYAQVLHQEVPADAQFRDKMIFAIYVNDQAAGLVSLIKNYPENLTTSLELLLLIDELHGDGIGEVIYGEIERMIGQMIGSKEIKLFIPEGNPSSGFFQKMGFKETGQTKTITIEEKTSNLFEMTKSIN